MGPPLILEGDIRRSEFWKGCVGGGMGCGWGEGRVEEGEGVGAGSGESGEGGGCEGVAQDCPQTRATQTLRRSAMADD